jgi:hypothetical protein
MKAPLKSLRFAKYSLPKSKRFSKNITFAQLRKIPGLFARAEESGAEACYVEVAKWNPHSRRYERFCFIKLFGGEIWQDMDDRSTATRLAAIININSKSAAILALGTGTRKWKCQNTGISFKVKRGPTVRTAVQYEFTCMIHTFPTWNPIRKTA